MFKTRPFTCSMYAVSMDMLFMVHQPPAGRSPCDKKHNYHLRSTKKINAMDEPAYDEDKLKRMAGAVKVLLECIGEDPEREGLKVRSHFVWQPSPYLVAQDTPERMATESVGVTWYKEQCSMRTA